MEKSNLEDKIRAVLLCMDEVKEAKEISSVTDVSIRYVTGFTDDRSRYRIYMP